MNLDRRNVRDGGALLGALAIGGLFPATCQRKSRATHDEPRRPSGSPKPLIEEDIAPVLARLDHWFAAHLRPDKYVFNPPASDTDLDAVEHLTGIPLPLAYRQLYRWHDGENDDRWGHFYGLPLLPLQRVATEWKNWTRVLAEFDGNRYMVPGGSWPRDAVDPAYINPRWIPLIEDGSGNHIGLDFDPWPAGRVGQVIIYGRDEDIKAVLAESLGEFLEWIAGLLERGNYRLGTPTDEPVLREFRLKNPPSNDFLDGARKLLGAPGPFL
jgi:cell wall assembly regulator SMI1